MEIKNPNYVGPNLASPARVAELIEELNQKIEQLESQNKANRFSQKLVGIYIAELKLIRAELRAVAPLASRFEEVQKYYSSLISEVFSLRIVRDNKRDDPS